MEAQGEDPLTLESVVTQPVFIPTVSPLPVMLSRNPRIGDTTRIAMFDPLARRVTDVTMRIEADSLFLVADSAHLDAGTGR